MQVGDVITSINGKTVDSLTPPIAALLLASGTPEIGQTIQLDMQRGGSPVTATVTSVKW
jgi:S1-C subfamily serine protease